MVKAKLMLYPTSHTGSIHQQQREEYMSRDAAVSVSAEPRQMMCVNFKWPNKAIRQVFSGWSVEGLHVDAPPAITIRVCDA